MAGHGIGPQPDHSVSYVWGGSKIAGTATGHGYQRTVERTCVRGEAALYALPESFFRKEVFDREHNKVRHVRRYLNMRRDEAFKADSDLFFSGSCNEPHAIKTKY